MTASMPVVTVTVNPTIDVAVSVDRLVPDHKLLAANHRRDPGGGGVNVSRGLRRLGVETVAWLAAGGAVGDELLRLLEREGIATVSHSIGGVTRESLAIDDLAGGEQYRIIVEGPVVAEPEALFDSIVAATREARLVVLSGMQAAGTSDAFFADLVDALVGRDVVVDTFGAPLTRVVERGPWLVKPSRRELESLVGRPLTDAASIDGAARDVLGRGSTGALVVSLGPDGAVLVPNGSESSWFDVPGSPAVASTVGAGDAMVAGIVAATVRGHDLVEATRWGVAAGSASVAAPGTGLFERADVERLLEIETSDG